MTDTINVPRDLLEDLLHHLVTSDRLWASDNQNLDDAFQLDNTPYISGLRGVLPPGPYTKGE